MKDLFKKRLKKLTALVVALVMMLPGQNLMVMAAETSEYDANSIFAYYYNNPGKKFYNKILKPGDIITNSSAVNYSANTPSISGGNNVLDYETFYEKLLQEATYQNEYEDYEFLAEYFKGWEVTDATDYSDGISLTLSPYLQFAHVDDKVALNTDSTVTFQVTLPNPDEIPANFKDYKLVYSSWGYATKVTEDEVISYKKEGPNSDEVPKIYFINPEDNEFYLFTPISVSEESQDGNELTLDLEEAQGKYIVYVQRFLEIVAARRAKTFSLNDDYGYYFSNLAQAKINYSVSYVKPDGTKLFNDDTGNSLEEFEITKTPSVDGYTFEGWYDNAKCTGEEITSIPEGNTENVTLYAKLTKKPATQPTTEQKPATQPTTEQKPATQPTTEQKSATQPSTDTSSTISQEEYEKNSAILTLGGKLTWKGKKLVITWGAVPGADGYDIIATRCGKAKMTNKLLVKTVPAGTTKAFLSKVDNKKLNLIKSYKVQVKAFKGSGASKQYIAESMVYHSAGKNSPFTNAKKVTIGKKELTLQVGQTFKLSPKTKKQNKKKKLLSANHAPRYRYLSSDKAVATVSEKGKITAVGTGTCTITVVATNGVNNSVKVTVN